MKEHLKWDDEAFDRWLSQKLQEPEIPFEEGAWEKMEKRLNLTEKRSRSLVLYYFSAAAVLLILLLTGWWFVSQTQQEDTTKPQLVDITTESAGKAGRKADMLKEESKSESTRSTNSAPLQATEPAEHESTVVASSEDGVASVKEIGSGNEKTVSGYAKADNKEVKSNSTVPVYDNILETSINRRENGLVKPNARANFSSKEEKLLAESVEQQNSREKKIGVADKDGIAAGLGKSNIKSDTDSSNKEVVDKKDHLPETASDNTSHTKFAILGEDAGVLDSSLPLATSLKPDFAFATTNVEASIVAVEENKKEKMVVVKKEKEDYPPVWSLSLAAAPDFTSTSSANSTMAGAGFAVHVEYRPLKRVGMVSGLFYSKKNYKSTEKLSFYEGSGGYYPPDKVKGSCGVIDVPLNIRYYFASGDKTHWFASTGISSYIMWSESYDMIYHKYGSYNYTVDFRNENRHLLAVYNISLGFERELPGRWALQIEPFLKLPATGVGVGKVKLSTFGSFFHFKYQINSNR